MSAVDLRSLLGVSISTISFLGGVNVIFKKSVVLCAAFFFLTCFSISDSFVSICPISFDILFRVSFPLITFCNFVAVLSGFGAVSFSNFFASLLASASALFLAFSALPSSVCAYFISSIYTNFIT